MLFLQLLHCCVQVSSSLCWSLSTTTTTNTSVRTYYFIFMCALNSLSCSLYLMPQRLLHTSSILSLWPDQTCLQAPTQVEVLQENILELLSRVCELPQGPHGSLDPQRFARLLGRLTELRTLRHNHLILLRHQPWGAYVQ